MSKRLGSCCALGGVGSWGRPARFALGAVVGGAVVGLGAFGMIILNKAKANSTTDTLQAKYQAAMASGDTATAHNLLMKMNDLTGFAKGWWPYGATFEIGLPAALGVLVGGTAAALPAKCG